MPNTLFDAIRKGRQQSKGTLLHLPDGSCVTDDTFEAQTAQLANALAGLGVEPGDRVAAQVVKSAHALALYVACIRVGAVFLPLNTAYTEDELAYFIGDAEPRVFACDPSDQQQGARLVAGRSCHCVTLSRSGHGTLPERANGESAEHAPVARTDEDLAAILYTSGTTGRSKGAMLTHANLLSNAQVLIDAWRFTTDDVLLHALPVFHTHGLFVAGNVSLISGGAMIFMERFDADELIEQLPSATTLMAVPTFYTRLLAHPGFVRSRVAHMRLFTSGSAPLLAETHRAFEERTGQRILERYGMTETNMSTSNPYDGDRIAGTVGLPLQGTEIRVCDPQTGKQLEPGQIGVLQVRGANVFKGYWRMPDKTREELLDDGFFITGDLVTVDNQGYVTIVGRDKDLIITGGYNVYPKEVEQVLDEQPGVLESAVVGAPHPDFGEAVVAIVVPDSASTATPDEPALRQSTAATLARYKQPKRVMFIDALPRYTMGKVQKNALREQFASLFNT